MREQINTGLSVADRWMERRLLMLCTDKGQKDSLAAFSRRLLQEGSSLFGDADAQRIHHIGFLDMTKFGRLGMVEIGEMASWSLRVLNQNPEYSNSLHIVSAVVFNKSYIHLYIIAFYFMSSLARHGDLSGTGARRGRSVKWAPRRTQEGRRLFVGWLMLVSWFSW